MLTALVIHAALLAGLLIRPEDTPPAETVIQVILVPSLQASDRLRPPKTAAAAKGGGPQANTPRPEPAASSGRTADSRSPAVDWRVRESGAEAEAEEAAAAGKALRASVGCQTADFVGLTQEERRACEARLAQGAEHAPAYAVVGPRLKKEFDGVFECPKGDVWCEYRVGKGVYPGLFAPSRKKRKEGE